MARSKKPTAQIDLPLFPGVAPAAPGPREAAPSGAGGGSLDSMARTAYATGWCDRALFVDQWMPEHKAEAGRAWDRVAARRTRKS